MARSIYNHFYTVFDWLWRRFGLIWRFAFAKLCSLAGYVRLALGWRSEERDDGRPDTDTDGRHGAPDRVNVEVVRGEISQPAGRLPSPGGQRAAEGLGKEQRVRESEWSTEEEEDEDEEEVRVEITDEFYCGYDSTWETEEDTRLTGASRASSFRSYKFRRFESAAKDLQNYRRNYPKRPQQWMWSASNEMPNIDFYLGIMPSRPDGVSISEFHNWLGRYDALEYVHSYIQWLFPLQEAGMNNEAIPLTKEEIERFLGDPTAKENLFKSYLLMLDFYGITMTNKETGEVKRASNWEDRFRNLNTHTHNNLRITRILKCLGTLGFPQYQAPLVRFFLIETLVNGELPNVKDSVLNYFVFTVLDKNCRRELIKFAFLNYDPNDEFVWCPKKLQQRWAREARASSTKGEGRTY